MTDSKKHLLIQSFFLIFISAVTAGVSSLFLFTLNYFFSLFTENLWLILILPFFGVLTLWLYKLLSEKISTSHLTFEGIIDYNAESAKNLGWGSALLVFISASLSQLFGASTGREGAAVQYGASLGSAAAALQEKFFGKKDFDLLIRAGIVAGFASLFGAPLAALVFLGERFGFRQPQDQAIKWAAVSLLSFYFSQLLKAPHSTYPAWPTFEWTPVVIFNFLILFIFILWMAFIYKKLMAFFISASSRWIQNPFLKILLAGFVLVALTWAVGSSRYNGLGTFLIKDAFVQASPAYDSLLKGLFTLISLTAGFKGGEVTPLMSIGALLGSSVSVYLSLPLVVCGAVGCIFFFSQVLGIPFTGAALMMELFGEASAPVALCAGFILWGFSRSSFKNWL